MSEPGAPQEPQKAEEPKSKLSGFLSHPIVPTLGLISAVVGLISLPLSFYFFYAAKEYPQLTYYPHPVKATVVRAGEASRLSAVFDNKPVETDITAAQIAIWNQGRRPIRREQVLRPFIIFTENNTPILEATVRKTSRDVTRLALVQDELQKGRVAVQWDILEQNDGGVIQLIYAGSADVQIKADGVIEGQPLIERLEFTGKIKSPYEQYESARREYRGWGVVLFLLGIVLSLIVWLTRLSKADYKRAISRELKSIESLLGFYDRRIRGFTKEITTLERYIAEFEQKVVEAEKTAAEEKMDVAPLVEFPNQVIAKYRKDQQEIRKRIEEYEREREKEIVIKEAAIRDSRKRERRYDITAIGAALLAFLAFIPAIYLAFIAQPAGPPFGF